MGMCFCATRLKGSKNGLRLRKFSRSGLLQYAGGEENACIEPGDNIRRKAAKPVRQSLFVKDAHLMAQRHGRCIQTTFSLIDLYASRESCAPEICCEGYCQNGRGKFADNIVLKYYHRANASLLRTPCRIQISKPDFALYWIQGLSSFVRPVV